MTLLRLPAKQFGPGPFGLYQGCRCECSPCRSFGRPVSGKPHRQASYRCRPEQGNNVGSAEALIIALASIFSPLSGQLSS